ncbi:MAG: zinc ABC transporter substrate-binding protein [Oscillospiraceae bacterium]|nr:zinc ABC transporter substrate-binding protein [Oscillospiraceae bacterium]
MRRITMYCALLLVLSLLVGCAAQGETASTSTRPELTDKTLSVVATVFPAFDWTRQIVGENSDHVALTLLLDKGTDFHNYQPTVEDIYKISTCDIFIYVGGESDKWVPDALAQATNQNMSVVCLMDLLGSAVKEEETVEGMEAEAEETEEEEEEGPEYDEHIWLSLRFAKTVCAELCDVLAKKDAACAASYRSNCEAYSAKLETLDASYTETVEAASRKTLLFADRFPFRYLADDYGLSYYAAFAGCSAETEASFETVNFLVNKVDELHLPYIMKLESSDRRLAETIISNTQDKNAEILELNSLQSVTAQQVAEGITYLGVMEQNLEVLKQALGA